MKKGNCAAAGRISTVLIVSCLGLLLESASAQNAISTGTKAGFRMFYPGSNDWWLDPSAGRFDVRMNGGAAKATIDSLGNLGIGTTNPNMTEGPGIGTNALTIAGAGNASNAGGVLELATTQPDASNNIPGLIDFVATANTAAGADKRVARLFAQNAGSTANNRGGQLTFWTKADGGASFSRMIIDQNGNVGIGTTSPQAALDVSGTIRQTGAKSCSAGVVTDANGAFVGCVTFASSPNYDVMVASMDVVNSAVNPFALTNYLLPGETSASNIRWQVRFDAQVSAPAGIILYAVFNNSASPCNNSVQMWKWSVQGGAIDGSDAGACAVQLTDAGGLNNGSDAHGTIEFATEPGDGFIRGESNVVSDTGPHHGEVQIAGFWVQKTPPTSISLVGGPSAAGTPPSDSVTYTGHFELWRTAFQHK